MNTIENLSPEMKELIRQEVQSLIGQLIKPQLLSINEAAQRLKIRKVDFINDLLSTGIIPFIKIKTATREFRKISEDSIHDFIQQNKFMY
jgi:hypothetical protein